MFRCVFFHFRAANSELCRHAISSACCDETLLGGDGVAGMRASSGAASSSAPPPWRWLLPPAPRACRGDASRHAPGSPSHEVFLAAVIFSSILATFFLWKRRPLCMLRTKLPMICSGTRACSHMNSSCVQYGETITS